MERLMYRFGGKTVEELQEFLGSFDSKEGTFLPLRELLISGAETARGMFLLDFPEASIPSLIHFVAAKGLCIPLFCTRPYSGETLHALRRTKLLPVYPAVSLLLALVKEYGFSVPKAQAVYLDVPWKGEYVELFRRTHTRLVIAKDASDLPEVAAGGFYGIPAVEAGEKHIPLRSLELPIGKAPLFTSPCLAPRMAMLGTIEAVLSCTFRRTYRLTEDCYRITADVPGVLETPRPFPPQPVQAFTGALEEGYGILLSHGGEELFLYGIHGDTGCFLTFDAAWQSRLLTRRRLETYSEADTKVILLHRINRDAAPQGRLFADSLAEGSTENSDSFTGRTAAVRYLNAFSSSEEARDLLSLRTFLEERLFIGEALKWFAAAEELYVDHLDAHLACLEKKIRPILKQVRENNAVLTPAKRLQWGDALQNCFASEEICLRECLEERNRMATYRRWAEELRKKS